MDENNIAKCGTIQDEFDKMLEGTDNIKDVKEYKIMRFAMCVGNENREECMDFSAADYYRCNEVGRMVRANVIEYINYIKDGKDKQTKDMAIDLYKNDCMHEVGLMAESAEAESFCGNIKNVADMLEAKQAEKEQLKSETVKLYAIVSAAVVGTIAVVGGILYLLCNIKNIKQSLNESRRIKNSRKQLEWDTMMLEREYERNKPSRKVCDLASEHQNEEQNRTKITETDMEEAVSSEGSRKTTSCQSKESRELDMEI